MATTGDFWKDGSKPTGDMDPDDIIIIPFDFSEYVLSQLTTYVAHIIEPIPQFVFTTTNVANDVISVRVVPSDITPPTVGKTYPVGVQIETADGQKHTKTLYLKIKQG